MEFHPHAHKNISIHTPPSCIILLVNWKRAQESCACLLSLEQTQGITWYAVLCDNASPDHSAEDLRAFLQGRYREQKRPDTQTPVFDYFTPEQQDSPRITLVLSACNLGFAGGNNLAYRHAFPERTATADFFWLLNNDTEVMPNTLAQMVARMQQDSSIGMCGSTLVYAHDRQTVQALGGAHFQPWTGMGRELGQGTRWPSAVDVARIEAQLRYISGASLLISRTCLHRIGLMCEDYFLYYEEIDWAERARKAGFRLGYAPEAVVFHKEGSVLGSGKSARRSLLAEFYGFYNRLVITRRFFPWALPTVYLFSLLQIVRRCMQGHWRRARMMCAVWLGLRHTPPMDELS
jgi:GT2 family glycosyltransferase